MPLIIKKRSGPKELAPVVPGGLTVVEAPTPAPPVVTRRFVRPEVKVCTFCHHPYINPCDDTRSTSCQNWLFLQEQGKVSL
jgi:hypothetical protein